MKTFAELYPTLSPEELREAEYNFKRYLDIVWGITRENEEAASKHASEDCGKNQG